MNLEETQGKAHSSELREPYQEHKELHRGGYVVRRRVKVWLMSLLVKDMGKVGSQNHTLCTEKDGTNSSTIVLLTWSP